MSKGTDNMALSGRYFILWDGNVQPEPWQSQETLSLRFLPSFVLFSIRSPLHGLAPFRTLASCLHDWLVCTKAVMVTVVFSSRLDHVVNEGSPLTLGACRSIAFARPCATQDTGTFLA